MKLECPTGHIACICLIPDSLISGRLCPSIGESANGAKPRPVLPQGGGASLALAGGAPGQVLLQTHRRTRVSV